jgi:hypothetical protein
VVVLVNGLWHFQFERVPGRSGFRQGDNVVGDPVELFNSFLILQFRWLVGQGGSLHETARLVNGFLILQYGHRQWPADAATSARELVNNLLDFQFATVFRCRKVRLESRTYWAEGVGQQVSWFPIS